MTEPTRPDGHGGCDAGDIALLDQWHTLYSGFRRLTHELLADVESETGLAPSSFEVLWFLTMRPARTAPMHQLTKVLGFSTAGTTKVVDRLAEAGFVERLPSPSDRRVTLAALTTVGADAAASAARTLAGALRQRLLEPLGSEHFAALAATIGSLATSSGSCAEG
ncbi:MarR family winged helix-turn-helix transcriptional regulator [Streptomyces sp. NK08204]|uniref:MarR family winged helix-turn-helix transcriptional regulator n=1 Tax=Streptomyces sp. NK08204 TaxID=2873260 RepID=UPI001CECD9C0|nr:MarR family transcriptional regulator [Streptomyces sp. NK08204]